MVALPILYHLLHLVSSPRFSATSETAITKPSLVRSGTSGHARAIQRMQQAQKNARCGV